MRDRINDLAHSATLLVSIAGCAADPTGLTLTGAVATGTLSLTNIFKANTPEAKKLVRDITAELEQGLANPTFHMPAEGRRLLPQMIEKALPNPAEIVGQNLNVDTLLDVMLGKLTDPAHRTANMAAAFCNLLRPSLTRLMDDQTFVTSLAPLIARATLDQLTSIADQVAILADQSIDTAEQLGMTKQFIISLAQRIVPEVEDLPTAQRELRKAIEVAAQMNAQARMPSNISDQVDAVLVAMKARNDLGDLNGAAAEIDRALSEDQGAYHARRIRMLEIALEQDILRRNAPSAAARIRDRLAIDLSGQALWDALYHEADHRRTEGLRFGQPFDQDIALALCEIAITTADADVVRARILNLKGTVSRDRGQNTQETALLAQAVDAFRDALTVFTHADHAVDWATTMHNLAGALTDKGTRTAGPDGIALLTQAVEAYRDALTVRTQANDKFQWAETTQDLAIVLRKLGARTESLSGNKLLAQAVQMYRSAMTVRTRKDFPVQWARTTQNLAIALQMLGDRTPGVAGQELLAQAAVACDEALTVRTREDYPIGWAVTKQNLANALRRQGTRTAGADGIALLARATAALHDALTVRTRSDHPVRWATTHEKLALAELARADHSASTIPTPHLHAALAHVDAALEVYDPDNLPYYHEKATRLRDDILARLP